MKALLLAGLLCWSGVAAAQAPAEPTFDGRSVAETAELLRIGRMAAVVCTHFSPDCVRARKIGSALSLFRIVLEAEEKLSRDALTKDSSPFERQLAPLVLAFNLDAQGRHREVLDFLAMMPEPEPTSLQPFIAQSETILAARAHLALGELADAGRTLRTVEWPTTDLNGLEANLLLAEMELLSGDAMAATRRLRALEVPLANDQSFQIRAAALRFRAMAVQDADAGPSAFTAFLTALESLETDPEGAAYLADKLRTSAEVIEAAVAMGAVKASPPTFDCKALQAPLSIQAGPLTLDYPKFRMVTALAIVYWISGELGRTQTCLMEGRAILARNAGWPHVYMAKHVAAVAMAELSDRKNLPFSAVVELMERAIGAAQSMAITDPLTLFLPVFRAAMEERWGAEPTIQAGELVWPPDGRRRGPMLAYVMAQDVFNASRRAMGQSDRSPTGSVPEQVARDAAKLIVRTAWASAKQSAAEASLQPLGSDSH